MSPETKRYTAVKRLFLAVWERPAQERAAFLVDACSGDPELRGEVEALLDYYRDSLSPGQVPAFPWEAGDSKIGGSSQPFARPFDVEAPTPTVPGYRLLQLLGEGGMGRVYEAEQLEPVRRHVALKLIKLGMDSRQVVARFESERQALAMMSHPNIAQVYDGGIADDGRPYFAMELLRGLPITDYAEEQQLDVRRRLELLLEVCDGVQHAHQRSIVHRDLKPSNVLVSDSDGTARVKIIDFGIAKSLGSPLTEKTLVTELGVWLGTPEYMSPEQAGLGGVEVDSRTDVYSLGALLYELLVGAPAFDSEELRTGGLDELRRQIRENTPVRPSARLGRPPSHSPQRVRELRGDLDWITMKSLEKNQARRYQSPSDLAADLRRYLAGEPVRAGRPSVAYSTGKWIVRHRLQMIAALGVTLSAVLLVFQRFGGRGIDDATERPSPIRFEQLTREGGGEYRPSLSPDGEMFLYDSDRSGNFDIYLRPLGGRNAINLTKDSDDDDYQASFSPDGQLIAFRSERQGGGIFVMGATGESPRRLADIGYSPSWSPDGAEIAFATEGPMHSQDRFALSQLWVIDVASGKRRSIFAGDAVQPSWSPDGRRLAYWGMRDWSTTGITGIRDIFTISVAGGDPVGVTSDAALDWSPVWSPDGFLYFSSDRSGSLNLWRTRIDRDGRVIPGGPEAVVTPALSSNPSSLSADGARIAYTATEIRSDIERLRFDPENERILGDPFLVDPISIAASEVDLSPGGDWIVFRSSPASQLHLVRSDGSERRQLTNDEYRNRGPVWSPDGRQVAFYSNCGGSYNLWLIGSNGSGLRQLTIGDPKADPAWSPDGDRIAYWRTEGSSWVEVPEGAPTAESTPLPAFAPNTHFLASDWSPDGRRIAGVLKKIDASRPAGMAVYDLESGQYTRSLDLELAGGVDSVSWLPDSRRVVIFAAKGLVLFDTVSRRSKLLLERDVRPGQSQSLAVSRDGGVILVLRQSREADVWLATLE